MHAKIRLNRLGMLSIYQPQTPIHWTWIHFSGPDAADFLNRLTTVNIKGLEKGMGAPGCFLDALGKIRTFFYIWHLSQDSYAFEFDAGEDFFWKDSLLKTIEQYTFSEKIEIQEKPEWTSYWFLGDEAFQLQPLESKEAAPSIFLFHHGNRTYGKNWISAWGKASDLLAWLPKNAQNIDLNQTEEWRIQSIQPRAGKEILPNITPLEIGLEESVIHKQGCYPGQEVIEKIISLGSPPKRLVRLQGNEKMIPGESLFLSTDPKAEIGTITSMHFLNNTFNALALVKKMYAKEGLEVQSAQGIQGKITAIAPGR